MLFIFIPRANPRITYVFKHICTRILGVEVTLSSSVEEFVAYSGAKISYAKQPLGNELFFQANGLLERQGVESIEVIVKPWDETQCFFAVSDKSALPFDIFSASFYLLSRYEEYLPHVKDALGRYPAKESLGYKHGFLLQPVVDIWALKFKRILTENFPDLIFPEKKRTIHTLIEARQPYAYAHKGPLRSLLGYISDLSKFQFKSIVERTQVLLRVRRDPFDTFKWIVTSSKKNRSPLTVFFLLGENPTFEESINSHRSRFTDLVKFMSDYTQVGLLFSVESSVKYDMLRHEKRRMESITHRNLEPAMNARFRVNLPDIYRDFVELEVKRDYTMVYENTPGFRAGTCTPFLFYDLDFEIKTPLTVHPIALTTGAYQQKNPEKTL
ncbi:MAG: hypothetical protein HKM28_01600, partial [Flavobacteriaceae bacterium]|nr:hypothetical protein [Flavobacteriaceae bacterium]